MILPFALISAALGDPILQNCSIKKIRVTGAQLYNGYNWSKAVMKSLGHFNGIYELEEDEVNSHPMWTKKRPDSKSDVSLQWTDDIYGATGWLLTNTPGQPRFFSYSVDDCPGNLGTWQLLEYGNKTVIGNEKSAEKIKVESLGDFKPIPSWVLAQLDDQIDEAELVQMDESDFPEKLVPVSDVYTMLAHVVPEKHFKIHTYGCNGIADLQFYSTPGIKTDLVTGAINDWKRCVTCAQTTLGLTADPYMFDPDHNICLNTPGNIERALCDCDYDLAVTVQPLVIDDHTLTNRDCRLSSPALSRNQKCCFNTSTGLFTTYNNRTRCCSTDGNVQSVGTC